MPPSEQARQGYGAARGRVRTTVTSFSIGVCRSQPNRTQLVNRNAGLGLDCAVELAGSRPGNDRSSESALCHKGLRVFPTFGVDPSQVPHYLGAVGGWAPQGVRTNGSRMWQGRSPNALPAAAAMYDYSHPGFAWSRRRGLVAPLLFRHRPPRDSTPRGGGRGISGEEMAGVVDAAADCLSCVLVVAYRHRCPGSPENRSQPVPSGFVCLRMEDA